MGAIDLQITLERLTIMHRFLCVETKVSQALIGFDFISKNKIDILTSANCLLFKNVPILTHTYKSQKSVGVIVSQDTTVYPSTEVLLTGLTEESEAQLITQDACILEPDATI